MERLPQVIDLHLQRKDGTVETVPLDFGEQLIRELPGWVAATGTYFALYYLVDAEARRYEERGFCDGPPIGCTEAIVMKSSWGWIVWNL